MTESPIRRFPLSTLIILCLRISSLGRVPTTILCHSCQFIRYSPLYEYDLQISNKWTLTLTQRVLKYNLHCGDRDTSVLGLKMFPRGRLITTAETSRPMLPRPRRLQSF